MTLSSGYQIRAYYLIMAEYMVSQGRKFKVYRPISLGCRWPVYMKLITLGLKLAGYLLIFFYLSEVSRYYMYPYIYMSQYAQSQVC